MLTTYQTLFFIFLFLVVYVVYQESIFWVFLFPIGDASFGRGFGS